MSAVEAWAIALELNTFVAGYETCLILSRPGFVAMFWGMER